MNNLFKLNTNLEGRNFCKNTNTIFRNVHIPSGIKCAEVHRIALKKEVSIQSNLKIPKKQ